MSIKSASLFPPFESTPGEIAICPYHLTKNKFKNTPVPQPQSLTGQDYDYTCVPTYTNLFQTAGFGTSYCKKHVGPVHLSFEDNSAESVCFIDKNCKQQMLNCVAPGTGNRYPDPSI